MRTDDIVNKVFTRSFMGYDIEQVDLFLDEVIERFEQCEAEKKEMLLAMEYLLNKLERNEKLPITEMRKAIDSGKTQKKRLPVNTRLNAPQAVGVPVEKPAKKQEETKPARSIARGAQPPKPQRAPKVSRVRTEPEQFSDKPPKEAAMTQNQATNALGTQPSEEKGTNETEAPAAENWLDELLMNLSERDRAGFGEPLSAAQQPECDNGDVAADRAEKNAAQAVNPAGEDEPTAVEEEPR